MSRSYIMTQTQLNTIHGICQAGKGTPYEQAFEQIMTVIDQTQMVETGTLDKVLKPTENIGSTSDN